MKTKKIIKKIMSLALAASLSLGILAGCGQSGDGKDGGKETESAKGRYLEEDIPLPEQTSVYSMTQMEDGTIRIATNDQEGRGAVWDLKEDDAAWEKVYDLPEEWMETDDLYVTHVAVSPKGDAFAVISQLSGGEASEEHYYHLDEKGAVTEVPLNVGEYLYFMQYAQDGELLTLFQNTPLSSVDMETGELTDKVSGAEDTSFFGVAGDTIYTVDYDGGILPFDRKTGEPLPKDENLSDSIAQSGASMDLHNVQCRPLVFARGKEEQEVFYCTNKGLYRHIKDGSAVELVIDSSLNSLGDPDVGLISMEATKDDAFYVLAVDSQSAKLLHFTYSADTDTVPETELKAWSLYENSELMQNISQYQKENPEVYVDLEVGVTEDNGVTASDALKNLSTEIMAGNGPDILMLDGLPVDSYVEKGMLEDLSDVAAQAEDLFENLMAGMEEDGKLYGIPLRFSIPLVEADTQYLEKIQDLESLADVVEEMGAADPDKNISSPYFDGVMLAAQLYDACSPAWIREDGTIDEEKLEEFYTQLGRIYDPEKYIETDYGVFGEGYQNYVSAISSETLQLYCDKLQIGFGGIWSDSTFAQLATTMMDKEGISYKPLIGQAEHVFLPKAVAGVSSKSGMKEEAKRFVQFLLTEEAQMAAQGGGLPVNQKALESLIDHIDAGMTIGSSMSNDPDSYVEMTIQKPSAEITDQFIAYIKEADTPALTNEIIRNAVLSQAGECLEGKIAPQEAVRAVTDQVDLYLAE